MNEDRETSNKSGTSKSNELTGVFPRDAWLRERAWYLIGALHKNKNTHRDEKTNELMRKLRGELHDLFEQEFIL